MNGLLTTPMPSDRTGGFMLLAILISLAIFVNLWISLSAYN